MTKLMIDFIKTEDKESKPKDGKPARIYQSVTIKSGEVWYSSFGSEIQKIQSYTKEPIKKGMEIECEVVEKEFNGKTFKNIKPIESKVVGKSFGSAQPVDLSEVNAKLDAILDILQGKIKTPIVKPTEVLKEKFEDQDIPF